MTYVDASYHHGLTLFLSTVHIKMVYMEIMVSPGISQSLHTSDCYSGHWIAQLRVVFQIPKKVVDDLFPGTSAPTHLAYTEWFSPLSATWDINHQMYRVTRLMHSDQQCATVIPVESILGSVHLLPQFGPITPHDWNGFSVLEKCNTFYVNPFSDRHNYLIFS